jgi:hypothetical protein
MLPHRNAFFATAILIAVTSAVSGGVPSARPGMATVSGTTSSTAASSISIDPPRVDFPPTLLSIAGSNAALHLTNSSDMAIDLSLGISPSSCPTSVGVPSPLCEQAREEDVASYSIHGTCTHLEAHASCDTSVTFEAVTARSIDAHLDIVASDGSFTSVVLTGTGTPVRTILNTVEVVEFYNAALHRYFMTYLASELDAIHNGALPGWSPTGYSFFAWPPDSSAPAGTSPVCRFYGSASVGLNAHFYTASPSECASVSTLYGNAWLLESAAFFYAYVPDPLTGTCPVDTRPVYRLFDARATADHRYMTSENVDWLNMRLEGWAQEGYGPDFVTMCSAPGIFSVTP